MRTVKGLLRKPIYVVLFLLVGVFVFTLVFQYHKFEDSTQTWKAVENKSGIFYRTQDEKKYLMNLKHNVELIEANSADVYRFLTEAHQKQAAEDAIFAEKILTKYRNRYLSITPEVIEDFVSKDKSVWNAYIFPNEAKWNCYDWQILRKEREKLWEDMLDLASKYYYVPPTTAK